MLRVSNPGEGQAVEHIASDLGEDQEVERIASDQVELGRVGRTAAWTWLVSSWIWMLHRLELLSLTQG